MKKRAGLLIVIAAFLLLGAVYLWGPSSVPSGQAPLAALSNADFGEFESAFDTEADAPRLVLLLSPT